MEKRRIIVVLIFVIFVFSFALGYFYIPVNGKIAREHSFYSPAGKLLVDSKYNEAISEFKEYLEEDPSNYYAHQGLGEAYYKISRFSDAKNEFKAALSLDPADSLSQSSLGYSHYQLKEYDDAIEAFEKALELDPDYWSPYLGLGWTYYAISHNSELETVKKLDYSKKAVSNFERSIELKDDDSYSSYLGLGHVYLWENYYKQADDPTKNFTTAIEVLQKSLELNPDEVGAYLGLGYAYQFISDKSKAAEYFEKALELNPNANEVKDNPKPIIFN